MQDRRYNGEVKLREQLCSDALEALSCSNFVIFGFDIVEVASPDFFARFSSDFFPFPTRLKF